MRFVTELDPAHPEFQGWAHDPGCIGNTAHPVAMVTNGQRGFLRPTGLLGKRHSGHQGPQDGRMEAGSCWAPPYVGRASPRRKSAQRKSELRDGGEDHSRCSKALDPAMLTLPRGSLKPVSLPFCFKSDELGCCHLQTERTLPVHRLSLTPFTSEIFGNYPLGGIHAPPGLTGMLSTGTSAPHHQRSWDGPAISLLAVTKF